MASQELDEFSAGMNGLACASQEPDFDEEEDNFESAQTLVIQETVQAGMDDAFTMKIKLEDMAKTYTDYGITARNAICGMLSTAAALEDFRMVCQQLDPMEFSELVACAGSVKSFHAYLEILNPQIAGYNTFRFGCARGVAARVVVWLRGGSRRFGAGEAGWGEGETTLSGVLPHDLRPLSTPFSSKQVKTMRALIVKFPDILGVIPMHDIDRMATTLVERFNITTMTSAMALTLTDEEAEEAIEKAKVCKAANKAKKEKERKILATAAAASTAGLGERELRKRARGEVSIYVDDEAQVADDDEADEAEPETAAKSKRARKGPSETDKLKAQVVELQKKLAASEARVAELEQQLTIAD